MRTVGPYGMSSRAQNGKNHRTSMLMRQGESPEKRHHVGRAQRFSPYHFHCDQRRGFENIFGKIETNTINIRD